MENGKHRVRGLRCVPFFVLESECEKWAKIAEIFDESP